jgi:hypothetical protein
MSQYPVRFNFDDGSAVALQPPDDEVASSSCGSRPFLGRAQNQSKNVPRPFNEGFGVPDLKEAEALVDGVTPAQGAQQP